VILRGCLISFTKGKILWTNEADFRQNDRARIKSPTIQFYLMATERRFAQERKLHLFKLGVLLEITLIAGIIFV